MIQISINEKDVMAAYEKADPNAKKFLETIFGKEMFCQKITDQVKTFEDACRLVNISKDMQDLLDYKGDDPDLKSSQAHLKITIIARALNQGWTPDWTDRNQVKYYPWPQYAAGVGVSYYDFARARIRLSVRAFATKAKSWQNMPSTSSRTSTTTF